MSTTMFHQINRSFIEKLSRKGRTWIESHLDLEKKALKSCSEEDKPKHEVYVLALEKALKGFN